MRSRGLGDPLLVASDGAPGIIKAIETCFPRSTRQRCLAHRMRNLAVKVPEDLWHEFKTRVQASCQAPSRQIARELADGLVADYQSELPNAVACYVVEDMGYDSDAHRAALQANSNVRVIPGRKNRKRPLTYDKTRYKLRKNIELFFGKIKENKRTAMRSDKLDETFLSFIALAAFKILAKIKIS